MAFGMEYKEHKRYLDELEHSHRPVHQYLKAIALVKADGEIVPLSFEMNGREVMIEKVLDIRKAHSLKFGGAGLRFTVRIRDRSMFLYLEEGRWYLQQT
jgi:hypothetical protein